MNSIEGPRPFNRVDDVISDPGGEDAMGADGAPYHFGDAFKKLGSGDVRGAIGTIPAAVESGVKAARRILGSGAPYEQSEKALHPNAVDMISEGGPVHD